MIVADTSSLVSIASIDLLGTVLSEFEVHTTETVVSELEETADYANGHGEAAGAVISRIDQFEVHDVEEPIESSRIDPGEGSTAILANRLDADFLLTDDLRALPELQALTDASVAISPIVLKALVKRDVLTEAEASARVDEMAAARDWLGAPIYRRARQLFETA